MSEQMALSTNEVLVYVPLLNEGVVVWRPTTGFLVEPNVVRINATSDYDPNSEEWEFIPGSTVRCAKVVRDGREIMVARQRVEA
jgi:hypothetical protein